MWSKKWKIYISLLIILGSSIMLTKKMRQNNSSNEVTRRITVAYGSIENIISTTGTVQPQNRLEIKPPIGGRIEEILVKEGDKVKIGQILVWMSSTERAALLDAARSQGEESLKEWQEVYRPTPLLAAIEGEVIVRAVEPGQIVTSADAVIVLSDRLIVKAQVDETDIGQVKLDQKAIISLDAYPQVKVEAKVDHISYESTIINNVTTYEAEIVPQRVPDVFRSGMSANVNIITESKDNILLIPLEAVKRDKKGSFVLLWQDKDREPVERRIELGIFGENNIEVISGLEAKDIIIIKIQKYQPPKNNRSKSNPFMPFGKKR